MLEPQKEQFLSHLCGGKPLATNQRDGSSLSSGPPRRIHGWQYIDSQWESVTDILQFDTSRLTRLQAFLRTSSPEPVLSLTASATLREKPLVITPDRKALAEVLQTANAPDDAADQTFSTPMNGLADDSRGDDELHGLQEVNLLSGLTLGIVVLV